MPWREDFQSLLSAYNKVDCRINTLKLMALK